MSRASIQPGVSKENNLMENIRLWTLTQETYRAIVPTYEPVIDRFCTEAGLDGPAVSWLLAALTFEPETISPTLGRLPTPRCPVGEPGTRQSGCYAAPESLVHCFSLQTHACRVSSLALYRTGHFLPVRLPGRCPPGGLARQWFERACPRNPDSPLAGGSGLPRSSFPTSASPRPPCSDLHAGF